MVCVPQFLKPRPLAGMDLYRADPFADVVVRLSRDFHGGISSAEDVRLYLDAYVEDGDLSEEQADDIFLIAVGGLPYEIQSEQMPWDLYITADPIGELLAFIVGNQVRHQPGSALMAAIQVWGSVLARRVRSDTGDSTNLYQLIIGPSASGKDYPLKAVSTLLIHSGGAGLVGTGSLTSATAALAQLQDSPSIFFPIDEVGKTLGAHKAKNAEQYSSELITLFLKLFSSSWDWKFRHKGKADKKDNIEICCPHVGFLGAGTPETVYGKVIDFESLSDGFSSRIISYDTGSVVPPLVQVFRTDPPESITRKLRAWIEYNPTGDPGWILSPDPKIITTSPEARKSFQAAIVRWDLLADRLTGESFSSLYRRCAEHARKYALIYACSEKSPEDAITIEKRHADWGVAIISWLTDRMLISVRKRVVASQRERDMNALLEFFQSQAAKGIAKVTMTEIAREFRSWGAKYRLELVTDLIDSGSLGSETRATAGRSALDYFIPQSEA